MVWGAGVILLVLLGIDDEVFYFRSMHNYGKTVKEYYSFIIETIKELEIENKTLKHIIDEIFKNKRTIDLDTIFSKL